MAAFHRLYATNASVVNQYRQSILLLQTQLSFKQDSIYFIYQVDHWSFEESSKVLTLKSDLVKNQLWLIKFSSKDVYITSVKRLFSICDPSMHAQQSYEEVELLVFSIFMEARSSWWVWENRGLMGEMFMESLKWLMEIKTALPSRGSLELFLFSQNIKHTWLAESEESIVLSGLGSYLPIEMSSLLVLFRNIWF